ncbi:MAG: endonuclease V [Candidatus Mcinerneyibacterium aminivorans]|uniref:Endonuclease V n=1 Tax=Candidatus Mcinerneyibacterium aminivorans TaxID=2703815 RepID=A0A5D0MD80_9BACT|nr:MAG: endonuclease V [Candidatus Mcinerneyibacterium aminivorans]
MNWQKCREFQKKIRDNLVLKGGDFDYRNLLAVDISFKNNKAFVAAVIYNIKSNCVEKKYTLIKKNKIKYVPTFLAFREVPYILRIVNKIQRNYDIILCDGHGIMHPYRAGLATHLGYLLNMPSVGVAKSYLCGNFDKPGSDYFSHENVYDDTGNLLGYALTNRKNTKPVFVSPGYKISFEKSLKLIKLVSGKYKVPEPIHVADKITKKLRDNND